MGTEAVVIIKEGIRNLALRKPPDEQMKMRDELADVLATLPSLPFDSPESRSLWTHADESLDQTIHADLGEYGEPCYVVVKHVVREGEGEKIRKRGRYANSVETVQHSATGSERESLALAANAPFPKKLFVIPFTSWRPGVGHFDQTPTVSEFQSRVVA
jgi:hypothetical protein